MRYLVDTDWSIDYFNGVSEVVDRLNQLMIVGVGMSVITLLELYNGIHGARDPQLSRMNIENLLDAVEVVPLDEPACRLFDDTRERLRSAGNIIPDNDLLIGATALSRGLTVLTNNRRHFERIEGLNIISVDKPAQP